MIPAPRVLVSALLAITFACTGSPPPVAPDSGPPRGWFQRRTCELPPQYLLRIWRGYDPERSAHIQLVPQEPNVIGNWLPHSGPWPYVQRVPLFLYGPGHVPPAGMIDRPATLADLAPTLARHIRFDFPAPDGTVLHEAVGPGADPPRLIVVMVWDGGGRNVLAKYPLAWPVLRSLLPGGAWFENATVGSSPSVTPAVHATIGTGAFPRRHGIIDLRFTLADELVGARGQGPENLRAPSLGDLYDRGAGNKPVVGLVGDEGTLGMIGQGAALPGGDRDVAIPQQGSTWGLDGKNAELFRFQPYVLGVPGLEEGIRSTDLSDGTLDGAWMGEPIVEETAWGTPAFTDYQTAVIEEVIRREGFGRDDIPDLLYTNYKQIDKISHTSTMNSPEMPAVIRSTDRALGDLIRILDREVGRGRWVIAVTADHGVTPPPSATGGFAIDPVQLEADVQARFDGDGDGRPVVWDLRVTQMWVDVSELAEHGGSLREVAAFLAGYTKGQNRKDPSSLRPGERGERVFEAVFPGAVLENLDCLRGPP